MLKGPRNALASFLAALCPARLAYFVALRVVGHAALDRFADAPASALGALDALKHWRDTKVDRPKLDPFEAIDRMPRRTACQAPDGLAAFNGRVGIPPGSFDPPFVTPEEDEDQVELVETALGRR